MRLGISSYAYTWAIGVPGHPPDSPLDAFGLVDKAIQENVSCVQIADNLPLHTLSPEQREALRTNARTGNVAIEVGMRGLISDLVQTYLEIATFFESPILRVVVDANDYHPDVDTIVGIVRDFVPELDRRTIQLAIENHDRFTARTFVDMLARINSNRVGICLDSVNSMGAGEGIETVVDRLAPFTINLHVKDFTVRRVSHMMGFVVEGTPAGEGMLAVDDLLKKLAPYNRCQSAILELWTPPETSLADTIAKEDRWAKQSIANLREWFP